ncbi:DUF3027 domain-containing protein [Arcanobacterium bovis]|uniref:DUF3027 domain-containing protein n=1 Tax=Arcanobacterium bovis TaxID=2529275 RepID=A0A4Q9V2E4_9ACTO|nr:DUF3027 domain-containing protein [Arcanobacterium bovis]TBW23811.1 DUF3027 domain-containing protein [Arcanobacterium bovis]
MSENRIYPRQKLTKEKILAQAIDAAREALFDITQEKHIGDHAGLVQEGERVVTHAFVCLMPGYRGWFWTVTLSRAPRKNDITISEVSLRPGEDALLAPEWIPWADRLSPADIGPSDRLPYKPDDARLQAYDFDLMQGYEETGVDADAAVQWEVGLGRARVLSDAGRAAAFRRWYRSDSGPRNQGTRDAQAQCASCGFFMKMDGSARQLFGVCANEWSPFDGRVVSLDHGCGAHSETDTKKAQSLWDQPKPVIDELDIEVKTDQ